MNASALGAFIGASTLLLGVASHVAADDLACRDRVYNAARKVLTQEAGGNRKSCVRGQAGDQTPCVDAEHPKAAAKRAQLAQTHADKCVPLPAFGVIADPEDIADAAEGAADDIIRTIFGNPVTLDSATKCNDKLAQRSGQLAVAQWKAFRSCANGKTLEADVLARIGSGIAAGTTARSGKVIEAASGPCSGRYRAMRPTAAVAALAMPTLLNASSTRRNARYASHSTRSRGSTRTAALSPAPLAVPRASVPSMRQWTTVTSTSSWPATSV